MSSNFLFFFCQDKILHLLTTAVVIWHVLAEMAIALPKEEYVVLSTNLYQHEKCMCCKIVDIEKNAHFLKKKTEKQTIAWFFRVRRYCYHCSHPFLSRKRMDLCNSRAFIHKFFIFFGNDTLWQKELTQEWKRISATRQYLLACFLAQHMSHVCVRPLSVSVVAGGIIHEKIYTWHETVKMNTTALWHKGWHF